MLNMSKNKGGIAMFSIVAIALALGGFWFLGKQATKADRLSFSIIPQKEIVGKAVIIKTDVNTIGGDDSVTSAFSKTLVSEYFNPFELAIKNGSRAPNEELVKSFYGSLEGAWPKNIPYINIEDISIVTESDEAVSQYIADITKIENDLTFKNLGKEVGLYSAYILNKTEEGKSDTIVELRKSSSVYNAMYERLSKMSVPENIVGKHKTITNAILDLSYGSQYLADGMLDPVLSVIGAQFYQKGILARERLQ